MRWRMIGPFRGGRTVAAAGIPAQPNVFYIGVNNGGVWKTTDFGHTWTPIFDDQPTGSIGALAIAPSNPNVIYVGSGEGLQRPDLSTAHGLYKSTDGGTTWRSLNVLPVPAKSPDAASQAPPSEDPGKTAPVLARPPDRASQVGRIGIAVAPSDPQRLYALVDAPRLGGLYRSEDAGENWHQISNERRTWGRGSDFAEVKVDPKNKDIVYIANTSTYRSTDGGKSFTAIKGAPGGDDYHTIWINPDNPQIILLAGDQGATITVNGGQTWSSWYNQPTAQFYHVSADNQFPYWVYGGQQESGSAAVASRGPLGQITFRDWHAVGVEEYGYVAPDPLHPNLIYGGKVTRFDRATGQTQDVAPEALRSGKARFLRTAPLLFSPVDPKTLYLAGNVLFKTTNGGNSWSVISPDLSRESPEVPANIG